MKTSNANMLDGLNGAANAAIGANGAIQSQHQLLDTRLDPVSVSHV